ncbi:hypothetical protein DERF_006629 [Dermatophagoides farinae]|uniref:Uncharacterized protein n=1 Tax=Dermatophagoides farinae TaxID=6954 RepID=A0A922I1R8_DERFA|nr:hypothetical protein DERF_006629 [Dermatophagoides farinae]
MAKSNPSNLISSYDGDDDDDDDVDDGKDSANLKKNLPLINIKSDDNNNIDVLFSYLLVTCMYSFHSNRLKEFSPLLLLLCPSFLMPQRSFIFICQLFDSSSVWWLKKTKIDYLCNEFDSKNGPENEMFFHFIFLSFSSTYVDNEIPF